MPSPSAASRRRGRGAAALGVAAALLGACGAGGAPLPGLHADGVVVGRDGTPRAVPPGAAARLVEGTTVLPDVARTVAGAARVAEQRAWLAGSDVPLAGDPERQAVVERALLDLRALTLRADGPADGAVLAGLSDRWRYVWPRDASFAVAAYCAVGRHEDAAAVLAHLVRVAPRARPWEARYLPDGSGEVPDDRPRQRDGAGWVLWAAWTWSTTAPPGEATRDVRDLLWPVVVASADELAASLGPDGLPPPGPDYWEKRESTTTLGVALPTVTGLRAAAHLARLRGDGARALSWGEAARRAAAGTRSRFGPGGWTRSGRPGDHDAAAALLAPPFLPRPEAEPVAVAAAWVATVLPSGGVTPGVAWKDDGVAWTPETALFGLARATTGDRAGARDVLDWLAAHRTPLGALPEKVLPDGSPAAVAPLAWTAALVVLTGAALDGPLPVPPRA